MPRVELAHPEDQAEAEQEPLVGQARLGRALVAALHQALWVRAAAEQRRLALVAEPH